MKKVLFLLCSLLFYSYSFSQSLVEKYNTYTKQYEYYNSSNQLVGYKKYNSYLRQWEYYENKPQSTYTPPVDENFEIWAQAAQSRQERYNYNNLRIQKAINDMRSMIDNSGFEPEVAQYVKDYMNKNFISKLNKMSADLSYDQNADNIINWLNKGLADFLKE